MERHGGNLNAYHYVKKAKLKRLSDSLKGKTVEKIKDQWLPRVWEGVMNMQMGKNFQVSETTLYIAIMMDTCHYNFVQTHRMYHTQNEP